MPVLQTVEKDATIKWILILAIHCPEVTISCVIGLLIDGQVGKHQLELWVRVRGTY